jgi:hypothetical protein
MLVESSGLRAVNAIHRQESCVLQWHPVTNEQSDRLACSRQVGRQRGADSARANNQNLWPAGHRRIGRPVFNATVPAEIPLTTLA